MHLAGGRLHAFQGYAVTTYEITINISYEENLAARFTLQIQSSR